MPGRSLSEITGRGLIVMALYPAQARKVMETKARLGWTGVRMVSSGPLTDEQYLDVPGGHSEGTLGFCHYPDPERSQEPGILEYRKLMATHHPGHPVNRYSLYGYVFGKLVVEGLTRAGRPDPRAVHRCPGVHPCLGERGHPAPGQFLEE